MVHHGVRDEGSYGTYFPVTATPSVVLRKGGPGSLLGLGGRQDDPGLPYEGWPNVLDPGKTFRGSNGERVGTGEKK